jgi:MerR family mercuric resistance operon transcriptional regulator
MLIGELAGESGVKLETIRYYERIGLLPAPPRTRAGYREFRSDHLRRLVFLRRSRQLGFSLREVRDLLNLANQPNLGCKDVTRVAAAHVTSVKAKIRELNRLRRALEQLVRACPGKVRIADCGILEALTGAEPINVASR